MSQRPAGILFVWTLAVGLGWAATACMRPVPRVNDVTVGDTVGRVESDDAQDGNGPDGENTGGIDNNQTPANDIVAAADYCESIVDFFCAFYLRCGRMAAATPVACRTQFLETCEERFEPSYVSLADAGLMQLSRAGIDACRTHLAETSCESQLRDLDGPCAGMWLGTQPLGGACGFDLESLVCAPQTACVLGVDLCGVCEQVAAEGEPCTADGVTCERAAWCSDSGVCVPRKRVNESCTMGDRCILGAACDSSSGTCQAPDVVAVGEACDLNHRCPYGAACVDGLCHATGGLGETCGPVTMCHSGFCDELADDTADDALGLCAPLVAQGAPCERASQCQTGACIDARCMRLPGACFR